jgi:hypothetical protein
MVVGTIIGASIFVQPSEITGRVPTTAGIYSVWLVCGVLTLFGALVSAELASTFPESGGVYAFLREAFGPWLGFLWAWAMFWTMHTGIIAAIATIFARYAGFFRPLDDVGTRVVAMAAVLVLSAVNYVGVRPPGHRRHHRPGIRVRGGGPRCSGGVFAGVDARSLGNRGFRAGVGRRAVRLRGLAHGDLQCRGDG